LIRATMVVARTESGGTLVHGGNTYSVVKGYGPQLGVEMMPTAYGATSDDLQVILEVADLATPHPEQNDACALDGEDYTISGAITKTPLYWMFALVPAR
jgi:hypothetical protein